MTRTSIGIAAALSAALYAGCGAQAGEDFLGEPLLRMRGQVTTTGLTLASGITPALCFPERVWSVTNFDGLPDELSSMFENQLVASGRGRARIMDVEVQGVFPAEFKVNVYSPPPAAALEPLLPGEPPMVWGTVCAVQAEHDEIGESVTVTGWSAAGCQVSASAPCDFTNVVMNQSASRYYVRSQTCPPGAASVDECTETRSGDVGLLSATGGYEYVVAEVGDPELVYLAAPAPAGSYTAYKLGARDGMPAGYHLLKIQAEGPDSDATFERQLAAEEMALAETNAKYGTNYDQLPEYLDFERKQYRTAPADIVKTFKRALARLEMDTIPLQERESVSPSAPGLTLELRPGVNLLDLVARPPPAGPQPAEQP